MKLNSFGFHLQIEGCPFVLLVRVAQKNNWLHNIKLPWMLGHQAIPLRLPSFTTQKVNKIRCIAKLWKEWWWCTQELEDTPKKKVANIGVFNYSKQSFYLLILVPFIIILSCRWYLTSISMKAYMFHISQSISIIILFSKSFYVDSTSKLIERNKIHCPQDHLRGYLIAWSSRVKENNDDLPI